MHQLGSVDVLPLTGAQDEALATARKTRMTAWLSLAAVVLLYLGFFVSGLKGMSRLIPLEILYSLPIAVTVVVGVRIAMRTTAAERIFWAALAGANAVLFACEILLVVWVAAITPTGPPPVSWPFHALHLVAAGFFFAMLAAMRRTQSGPLIARTRVVTDLAIVSLAVTVVLFEAYVWPVMHGKGAPWPHVLVGLGYPMMGTIMLVGTLWNV
ncbi:MAG: hypothetical protein FDZ75_02685, partial [Actinobacteria bacterium]